MWLCKHCGCEFKIQSLSEKANHSRWCDKNPKRNTWNKKQGTINKYGDFANFSVDCYTCGKMF